MLLTSLPISGKHSAVQADVSCICSRGPIYTNQNRQKIGLGIFHFTRMQDDVDEADLVSISTSMIYTLFHFTLASGLSLLTSLIELSLSGHASPFLAHWAFKFTRDTQLAFIIKVRLPRFKLSS
jgi:hypothetical protein